MTSFAGGAVATLLQFHSRVMDFVVLVAAVGLSGLLAVGGTRAILSVLLLLMMRGGPQPVSELTLTGAPVATTLEESSSRNL